MRSLSFLTVFTCDLNAASL